MLENTGILVAGLSGGADSVCLVAVLKEIIEKEQLDIRLLAVHVNHGIRGTEAERDEQFDAMNRSISGFLILLL